MTENIQQFLERFHTGGCADAYRFLGCHCLPSGGAIVRVWAPRAESVSVVGEFNFWNEQDLPMQKVSDGVWEAFSVYAAPGGAYKYCVTGPDGRKVYKSDPYGTRCKALPDTSSLVEAEEAYPWHDGLYRSRRAKQNVLNRPLNIYEVHAGSWKRHPDGGSMGLGISPVSSIFSSARACGSALGMALIRNRV